MFLNRRNLQNRDREILEYPDDRTRPDDERPTEDLTVIATNDQRVRAARLAAGGAPALFVAIRPFLLVLLASLAP